MATTTPAVERGCGSRVAGGIYAVCPVGRKGHPVDCFVLDPPQPCDAAALGLTAVGTKLFQDAAGAWHVLDIVGRAHYPTVPRFLEEAMRYGISRRLAPRDLEKLDRRSRLWLAHERAGLINWPAYRTEEPPQPRPCSRGIRWEHCQAGAPAHGDEPCIRYLWQDEAGELIAPRTVRVTMPAFQFEAHTPPADVVGMHFLAFFARFPFSFEIVRDLEGNQHEGALKAVAKAALPFSMVED